MRYDPGVQDRSGILLGAGIADAARSMGAAIEEYGNRRDELKGYRQVALALGLPADQVDGMTLGQVKGHIMANEITQQKAAMQAKQRAQAAVQPLLQTFARAMQPRTTATIAPMGDLNMDIAGAPGGGPSPVTQTTTPGMSPLDAMLSAASSNPEALNTEIGSSALNEVLKRGLVQPKAPPQVLDMAGTKVLFDPSTGRTRQLTQPRPAGPVRTPDTAPLKKSPDGKFYWDYQTSAWKPMAAPKEDIFGAFGGSGGADGPAAGSGPTTVSTQEQYDALESGAQYLDEQGNLRRKK